MNTAENLYHNQDEFEVLHAQLETMASTLSDSGKKADASVTFSVGNYELLKQNKLFSAMVPNKLGGAGLSYQAMCHFLTELAAFHPSTALSFSMHQHILGVNVLNYKQGRPGQAMLEKVAANELALVSTGAGDWLASNGVLEKTEGGYLFSGLKHFASGSPGGDVLVTSGPYEDADEGWQVFHFPVPLKAKGVTVLDNWNPMGMKGTGSNSIKLEKVFILESSIAARRPRGDFHAMWCVIVPVALPLIMSVYRGVAQTAAKRARRICDQSKDPVTPYILGEMENALVTAELAVEDMIRINNDLGFKPSVELVNEMVKRKTIAANACKETCAKAVEVCGGLGFIQSAGIESLYRDACASHFHPLQEKRQLLFTGSLAMGNPPPSQAF